MAERRRRELSDLSISEEVHKSQKIKDEDVSEHNSSQFKLNDDTLLYKESMKASKVKEKEKPFIVDFSSSESEEEEKKDVSNESQGEMIVYLDPDDYEKEAKEKRNLRSESPDRLAMRTTANFFQRRKNVRYDENEVEIIKVEQASEEDKSDLIS